LKFQSCQRANRGELRSKLQAASIGLTFKMDFLVYIK